jgi:hypothetical protein
MSFFSRHVDACWLPQCNSAALSRAFPCRIFPFSSRYFPVDVDAAAVMIVLDLPSAFGNAMVTQTLERYLD